jgi:hypothetical protein
MAKTRNRFGTGGCYSCKDCKRQTRSTGRGDNEHCGLCVECYDRCSLENEMSDCGETPERLEEWRRLVAECLAKGGNPTTERWWAVN